MQDTKARINELNISELNKKDMLTGLEKGISKYDKQRDEQWRLEKQVVLSFENMIVLLASSKNWVVEGERILFYSDDDLVKFNTYMGTIQSIAQQQEQILKGSLDIRYAEKCGRNVSHGLHRIFMAEHNSA